ncbi:ABC transporter substrate-binding protein [Alteromonas sp. CYL-A6]|uniref:ABC transporter substrate-binding protein n=1 Tax=Alteromonas nitratireducens TaxID=3390813 RepID=UPI0034B6B9FA
MIDSYHADYPWVKSYRAGLEDVLLPAHSVSYFEMNTKRIPHDAFGGAALAAWQACQQQSPDIVMLADDNALKYVGPILIDHHIPFVYFGINANPRDYGIGISSEFGGVLERLLIKRAILLLRRFADVKRVLVLFDNGTTSSAIVQTVFENKPHHTYSGIAVDVQQATTFADWQQAIHNAGEYDAVLVGLYQTLTDEHGNSVPEETVIAWTSDNAGVPPFALWDYAVGSHKAVGGYVISGYDQGKLAGQIAAQFEGKKGDTSMPQTTTSSMLLFSRAQLIKWNLTIPADLTGITYYVD